MRFSVLHVRRLWRGNKGRSSHELELPPLCCDAVGYPFAVSEDEGRLCLCNEKHLLLWTLLPNHAVLVEITQPFRDANAELWGITSCKAGWLVVVHKPKELMLTYLDHRLRILKTVMLEGFLKDYDVAPPLRVRLGSKGRIYFADAEEGVTVDGHGRTASLWKCPHGFTSLVEGELWLPPPSQIPLAYESPLLLGIDKRSLYYWQIDMPSSNRQRPYIVTSLGVCDSVGTVKRRIILNGTSGVLPELHVPSQVQWIEIARSGRIYVLGWTYKGLRGAVGLWRLSM